MLRTNTDRSHMSKYSHTATAHRQPQWRIPQICHLVSGVLPMPGDDKESLSDVAMTGFL
jgi:hypothetical protein